MSAALDFDPAAVELPRGHWIGGELVAGPESIEVRRPSDGVVYAAIPDAGAELVDRAARTARAALETSGWGRIAPRERARLLRRWADLVEADVETLARLEAVGSTRPIREAVAWDVPYTAETIRFFAELADKHGGEVAATRSDSLGLVIAEPIGVVGAIAPWNFPLAMAAWKCAPALAAGNAVVLKPSELTPFSVLRLAQLALRTGLPAGVFNVVNGLGPSTGDAIAAHPLVGKLTFTGSNRTGSAIMARCAQAGPKPVTLELGGKSPQLVFDDVRDLGRVASLVARAILGNAGQVCNAGSRLIVQRRIADALVAKVVEEAARVQPGQTWRAATTFSPIVSERQAERVQRIVDEARAAGARALTGGAALDAVRGGCFYAPTVLVDVQPAMTAVREEIFGPVLTVQPFDDDEQGYALANDSIYGLAAGVHTGSIDRALRAIRRIEAGSVWVNRYGRSNDFAIPTGGFKSSGIGKDLGVEAFKGNLRYKSALIDVGDG
ncbi:MAG: aldehyde dehydrogenase family protein [Gammaproteobacteria bacterium]|nr:aldehyde dehydrogenase family protein [Gammaproteobacteria bacterium]